MTSVIVSVYKISRAAAASALEGSVSESFAESAEARLQIIRAAERALRNRLAVAVIDSLTEALVLKPRRANPGNNFVTRIPVCPAVLVECGFLSHPEEERLLQDEAYQRTLAEAVARGVIAYLEGADTGR